MSASISTSIPDVDTTAIGLKQAETLTDAAALFARRTGPRVMFLATAIALVVRLYLGSFAAWDLAVAAVTIVLWWIQEWLAHLTLLHMRPRRVLGVTIDPIFAQFHRAHHQEPWSAQWVLVPVRFVVLGFFASALAFFVVLPTLQLAATAWLTYCLMGVIYEWTHLLVHTRYKPQSAFFREIWKNHRLHHFKNEGYWFGLSGTFVDHLMRTAPDAADVPTSATTRTLGVSEEAPR